MNILIVEDTQKKFNRIAQALRDNLGEDTNIVHASYVNQGLCTLEDNLKLNDSTLFDFVISDMNMPILSDSRPVAEAGIRIIRSEKRFAKRYKDVKIPRYIVISSFTDLGERLEKFDIPFQIYSDSSTVWSDTLEEFFKQ